MTLFFGPKQLIMYGPTGLTYGKVLGQHLALCRKSWEGDSQLLCRARALVAHCYGQCGHFCLQ